MKLHVCPWWLVYFHSSSLRKLVQNPYKILDDLVEPGQTVLDIGCGPGFFTVPMAEMVGENGRVIAADIQAKMLGFARRRAERAGLLSRIQKVFLRKSSVYSNRGAHSSWLNPRCMFLPKSSMRRFEWHVLSG